MTEIFEASIQEYFRNRKSLEYLNLEYPKPEYKQVGNLEFYCFQKGFKHKYHTESQQLNLITDITYLNSHNLTYLRDNYNLFSKVCLKHFHSLKDHIKTLENKILELETNIPKNILGKEEAEKLILSIIDHPKKIEAEALLITEKLDSRINQVELLVNQVAQHFG